MTNKRQKRKRVAAGGVIVVRFKYTHERTTPRFRRGHAWQANKRENIFEL